MKLNTLFEGFSKQIYSTPNESSDDDSTLAAKTTNRLAKWENEKYRMLLDDSIIWKGHTLYRIQYKKDITLNKKYYRARKDSLGGYIEILDNLSEKGACVVNNKAKVWGNAKVFDDARVFDDAQVYGDAKVYGDAWVGGNAKVFDDARVFDDAQVYGDAEVWGNARVYGRTMVCGYTRVSDNAQVYGDAKVHGLSNNGFYNNWIYVYGKSEIYGDADVCNNDYMDMNIEDKKINH